MKTATITGRESQGRSRPVVLFFLIAVLLGFCLSAFSSLQAYADEPQNTETLEQQDAQSGTASPRYEVYTFDSQDVIEAQTNQSGTATQSMIPDSEIPLSSASRFGQTANYTNNGSFFNTVIALVCIASMIVMLWTLVLRRAQDYRVVAVRTIASAFGLVTIATWSLFDKLQFPAVTFNDASVLIAILFTFYMVIAIGSYVYEARLKKVAAEKT